MARLTAPDSPYGINKDLIYSLLSDSSFCNIDSLAFLPCYKNDSTPQHNSAEHSHTFPVDQAQLDIAAQIGGGWSESVPFCCDDACKEVVVEVLAMDYWCNFTKSWVTVQVEDKSAPEVRHRLPDLNISCYAYNHYYRDSVELGNWDVFGKYVPYERYGSVSYTTIMDHICTDTAGPDGDYHETIIDSIADGVMLDNCGFVLKEAQKTHFAECGVGWLERTFTFTSTCNDEKGDSTKVVQRINIYNDCPLRETDIIWPGKDTSIYGCGYVEIETAAPVLKKEDDCREIGIHYKDQVIDELYNADSTCLKILRKWAVIDWCRQTADFHDDWIGDQQFHYYEFDQIIYVKDPYKPEFIDCDIDTLCIGSNCNADLRATVTVIDSCTTPDDIKLSWQLYQLTDFGYEFVASDNTDTAKVDDLSIGTYKLAWTAVDECHNESYCTDFFEVHDCVKPSPVCLTSTTVRLWPVDLDQDGQIDTAIGEVWAQELDVSSHDNCQEQLTDFRIRWQGTGEVDASGNLLPPDSSATKLALGCGDIGTAMVELWVIDQWGNADFCEVLLEVIGPIEGCSGELGKVKGLISSVRGAGIPAVEMQLKKEGDLINNVETDRLGRYVFPDFRIGAERYELHPYKKDDPVHRYFYAGSIVNIQAHHWKGVV